MIHSPMEISGNRGCKGDKAKGIICKPMPKEWHDRHSANHIEDDEKRKLYLSLAADKKPYFMRYIYPSLMKKYNTYIKNTEKQSLREFDMTVDELKATPYGELSERQKEFLRFYDIYMPVGVGDCVMNKICRRFEEEFDGYLVWHKNEAPFDYTIMKNDKTYEAWRKRYIMGLYEWYRASMRDTFYANRDGNHDEYEAWEDFEILREWFVAECSKVVPDRMALCNMILDICYKQEGSKQFAWDMCGDEILESLLERSGHVLSYPVADENGSIEFNGMKFEMKQIRIGVGE